jgi:dihydroorotase/N-acyl-D-amino-acid deacylase
MLGQSEVNLLIDPRAMSKVMQGVTTEVTGEGGSIAPMNERLIKEDADYYRRFNLTIDWRTLAEYFRRVERQGLGLNLATFVGATQVRAHAMGFDNRAPPMGRSPARSRTRAAGALTRASSRATCATKNCSRSNRPCTR